jgi:nucleotide-binding universal stress UspA family protein
LLAAVPSEAKAWCEIDVVVATGSPGAEIRRLTQEHRPDLVVIGAPRRWTSTAHAVLNASLCPVLVAHEARPLPWPADLTDHSMARLRVNRTRS